MLLRWLFLLTACIELATSSSPSTLLTNGPGNTAFKDFAQFLLSTQSNICSEAERSDGKAKFCTDVWRRETGEGFGVTRVLEGGELLEKAACSVSIIHGVLSAERAKAMSSRGRSTIDQAGGQPYAAAAMSLVFHSASPLVPTFRADVRLFQVGEEVWYGGGADLTPFCIVDQADFKEFHALYAGICEEYEAGSYRRFKQWCDEYFYIPHRKEHRGIGGIFFDDLSEKAGTLPFVKEVAESFMPSFLPLAEKRGRETYTEAQRQWQLMRRGRYIEFNLLNDRGVAFGLKGGRIESIMVSAPPLVSWVYDYHPAEGTPEAELVKLLKAPKDWV
ncbi:unnamed protein product [Chrysoparadoxa australica]